MATYLKNAVQLFISDTLVLEHDAPSVRVLRGDGRVDVEEGEDVEAVGHVEHSHRGRVLDPLLLVQDQLLGRVQADVVIDNLGLVAQTAENVL